MQPEVKTWAIGDDPKVGTRKCTATLVCRKCGNEYPFIFNLQQADILYEYEHENIAREYINRAAPVLCNSCL